MAREPIDIRKSMRARITGATSLVTLVLIFSPILFFDSGLSQADVYILFTMTAFALLAIISCIFPLIDRAYPKQERESK